MTRRIDPSLIPEAPDLSFEHTLWKEGILNIAGIDEAGRGCLAGPVTAAAVILPRLEELPDLFSTIRDSKQLSREAREREQKVIEENSLDWGVGFASNQEIDQYGIVPATRLAVSRALAELKHQPEHLLVDYIVLPDNPLPQTRLVKGDARSLSIAAASILAKTHRDTLMITLAERYPIYDLGTNKGYGTAAHREAIQKFGPSPLHRMSFAPIRSE
ncbi:MAG TPA: ribonuclease HII [Chloroflexi bacterium]|nr:ribonuclease HII [Chloroflexota bacterium]